MSVLDTVRAFADCRGLTRRQVVQKVGQLVREADDAACRLIEMATEIDELKAERGGLEAQLDQAGIDVSTVLDDLRISRGETERALAALTATKADLANATAVSDLPQHVSTQPVPVVQQRFADGPVVHLNASPMAAVTDPGHVRAASWGVEDTT
ncbi:hypothetical protein [Streptomyces sp. NPDC002853]